MTTVSNTRVALLEGLVSRLVEFTGHRSLLGAKEETVLSECGLDSLSMFNFLLDIENAFAFRIPDEAFTISQFRTLGDILDVLTEAGVQAETRGRL